MSKTIVYENVKGWGKVISHLEIDDRKKCKHLCDEVCCNEDCDNWANYPPIDYCRKNTSTCEYFGEEE